MKMKRIVTVLCYAMPLLFGAGCLFEKYHAPQFYDLGQAEPLNPPGISIEVKNFNNRTGTERNMRYRTDAYHVVIDPYNKWAQPPGDMLTRFFSQAFSREQPGVAVYTLEGTIIRFDTELDKKTVTLQLDYQVLDRAGNPVLADTARGSGGFKTESPEEFAAAATAAATATAQQIAVAMQKLPLQNHIPAGR